MENLTQDFRKYAVSHGNARMSALDGYMSRQNSIVSPTIVEETQLNGVTIDVFSRLMVDRIIFLGTVIDSDVANIVASQLLYLNSVDKDKDIKLFINSPGGSVDNGLAIYDVMNWLDCDVATYGIGSAASMACVLLSSGTKGKRRAFPSSEIMMHQVSGLCGGQCADVQIAAREIEKAQDKLYRILSENTGKSMEQIRTDADRDKWFTADEAVEYGLIDEVVRKK